jgi:CheY-like chemotaxis protein
VAQGQAIENARLYAGLEAASRLKDEFLATLSHELRTPLNAILGYARMLRAGLMQPPQQHRAVETIERNAMALTQIVEDVLDVSRIVSGKIRLHVQPLNLAEIVGHAVEAVGVAAQAKGVTLDLQVDAPVVRLSGDPDRLQQVIWNVLSNAVKFTNRGGRVDVAVRQGDGRVDLIVRDTGSGIAPAFLPHIFERFRQADSGISRETGGLGLGLSIARQLVEMHGGTITAESEGPGKGSTFRIALPVALLSGPVETTEFSSRPVYPASTPVTTPDLTGVKVLAVDDDPDALRLLREILEITGASVAAASSAAEALELVASWRPDVLIADIGMPRMDGFELIRRIRQHPDGALHGMPAVALTAYARSEDRLKALSSGFQIYITKPIDPGELMVAIAALVRRQ